MKTPSKILLVISSLDIGGAENVLIEVANFLDSKGDEVTVCLLENRGKWVKRLNSSINIITLNLNKKNPLSLFYGGFRLRKLIKRGQMSGVISFLSYVNFFLFLSTVFLRLKKVFSERISPEFYQTGPKGFKKVLYFFYLKILPFIYSRGDHFVVQSQNIAHSWEKLGVCKGNIRVIPNGFNFERIEKMSQKPLTLVLEKITPIAKKRIVTLARCTPQKNPEIVFSILKIFENHPLEFPFEWIWAGDGELLNALQNRVEKECLDGIIRFIGPLVNPFPLLKSADLFILPSLSEGFPNVVIEALFFGIPVLASSCHSATLELLQGGIGTLIDPTDTKGWAEGIRKSLSSSPLNQPFLKQRALEFDGEKIFGYWGQLISSQ